jgi:hypothetical protein
MLGFLSPEEKRFKMTKRGLVTLFELEVFNYLISKQVMPALPARAFTNLFLLIMKC